MPYIIKSSEKLRKPAAEMETKALLYLMNFDSNSDDIHYFVVDFFNDLTGMDNFAVNLYDLQSKGAKNSSPKAIGKELVTLYKNYLSDIDFREYILFLGGVTGALRINDAQNSFDISNIKDTALEKLITGLKEECANKTYIDDSKIKDDLIDDFLKKVLFIVDDKSPAEYVMKIVENHSSIIPDTNVLNAIFNEIRDKQSAKKNVNDVEDITICVPEESLNYFRHLTSSEIKLLTLQRIINRDPVSKNIPQSFIPIYNMCPPESQKELIENCQQAMCRALFNKNQAENFWMLFEDIYVIISNFPNISTSEIYKKINREKLKNCTDLDTHSAQYFVSIIKDGVEE
ncbi:MAG: hypothetical protein R3Y58_11020 [Eubacteriales bacterium]